MNARRDGKTERFNLFLGKGKKNLHHRQSRENESAVPKDFPISDRNECINIATFKMTSFITNIVIDDEKVKFIHRIKEQTRKAKPSIAQQTDQVTKVVITWQSRKKVAV